MQQSSVFQTGKGAGFMHQEEHVFRCKPDGFAQEELINVRERLSSADYFVVRVRQEAGRTDRPPCKYPLMDKAHPEFPLAAALKEKTHCYL